MAVGACGEDCAIEVRDLAVVRGERTVLHGLTFGVGRGAITGLVGPSGCGKTTLMRAIVGTQEIAGGSVHVLGLAAGSPQLRRRIGYVTQAPSVYPDLTVRENLDYFAAVVGEPRSRIEQAMREVDLLAEANRRVDRLSGGQAGRVSLAAALLAKPDILILDEPTVGLDPVLRRDLWNLFDRLAAGGITLLVSSHVMDEAERCRSILLLREGELLADATPQVLKRDTGSTSVEEAFLAL
ncbi:MAG: ABC transporter ATP-binding protein, partial [Chloroflexota bacterium]|nr:ABC transporter ATP-binding protein [Chloroflexota bacterium]